MQTISKKLFVINIVLSQVIVFSIGLILLKVLKQDINSLIFFPVFNLPTMFLGVLAGSMILLMIQYVFLRFISKEKLLDDINILLMEKFTIPELSIIFFAGAFAEEFLFRGIIQPYLGIGVTSILFTLIHFRYLKKGFILLEVFLLGLVLGLVYHFTAVLWAPILCHFIVNLTMAILIKGGKISYQKTIET